MRVGMISPIAWRTPPRHYGPWEFVTSLLTEALVARGVDVTLFATLDSETRGTLGGVCPRPYEEDRSIDPKTWEMLHVAHVFERAHEFDVIHNQADFVPLAFARLTSTPMITTIHGFTSPKILPIFERYNDIVRYVAISDADRAPSLRYAATIHHGIPIEDFPFDPVGGEHLLFYGRMHHDKGAAEAIEVAERTGHRLEMAGIVQDAGYFDARVKPRIDGDRVAFHGAVGGARRAVVLGGAKALLHLVNFNEPFGLSVAEAMACGTPVIATRRGAMPELIEHGKTGFLVNSLDEAITAIGRLDEIDRGYCRARAVECFSVDRMAEDYLALYRDVLEAPLKRAARRSS